MGFDNESVEAQIHGLLAERGDEFASTADVTWVAENGQCGDAAAQLEWDLPHGRVAIEFAAVAGESAVDGTQTADAGSVDAFHAADPEFEVGVDGIFHEHGDVDAVQTVGQCLHGKRVGRGTCTDP